MVKGQYTEISKDNFESLKKDIIGLKFDDDKIGDFIRQHYRKYKYFSSAMDKKYGHEHGDTNLSFGAPSTVTKALKGDNPNLTAKLLLYLIVEHNIDYKDYIKEDKTEYYKKIEEENEDISVLKEIIEQQNKTIDSLEELRKRNDVIITHFTDMLSFHKEQIQLEKSFIKKFINAYYNNNEEFKVLLKIAEDKYQN